jgi:hypothetical protein
MDDAIVVSRQHMDFDSDFLKDRYDYELRRREDLTSALSMPVGVLTVLGGAMATMAKSFSYGVPALSWAFGVILAVAVVAFIVCMVRLACAYHPQKYLYLPLLGALHEAREEWRAFYAETRHDGADDDFFEHELEKHIIDAADRNTRNNDYRSDQLHLARIALFAVLVLTALLVVPYVVDQVRY